MVSAASIRTKLQNKIFTPYGKSVTLKRVASPNYNIRGERETEGETVTSSTISIIPYNLIATQKSHESFGELQSGEFDAAVPYSVTLAVTDVITMDGEDWTIIAVENNLLPTNVVTIIRLSKNAA